MKIIGSYLSPYERKVLVALHLNGLPYEIDPIIPFLGDERFAVASPLRRIPVLIDGTVTLSDSSMILQYLEDRYPQPALYPADVADRARTLAGGIRRYPYGRRLHLAVVQSDGDQPVLEQLPCRAGHRRSIETLLVEKSYTASLRQNWSRSVSATV